MTLEEFLERIAPRLVKTDDNTYIRIDDLREFHREFIENKKQEEEAIGEYKDFNQAKIAAKRDLSSATPTGIEAVKS